MSVQDVSNYVLAHTRPMAPGADASTSVGFFSVLLEGEADAETLASLIAKNPTGEFCALTPTEWSGGPNYIQIGGWIGDQEAALRLIGLGGLLGLWVVGLPEVVGIPPGSPDYASLLGSGFVYAIPNGRMALELAKERS